MMRKMKVLALFLAAILWMTSLSACNRASTSLPTATAPDFLPGTVFKGDVSGWGDLWAKKKLTVGFCMYGQATDWEENLTISIQNSAPKWNVILDYQDAQCKQDNEVLIIREFIAKGVDAILLNPLVEEEDRGYAEGGWGEALQEVKDAGIPLILVDRTISDEYEGIWTSHMGSDYYEDGKKAANGLMDYLAGNNRDKEDLNIVELRGTEGSSAAKGRGKGFKDVIEDKDNLTIIDSQNSDFSGTWATEIMEEFLEKHEKIDVLYAHNDDMALGAIEAIEEAGLHPGEDILIVCVSYAAFTEGMQLLIDGKMNCVVESTPLFGPQLMEACVKLSNGETVEKEIKPIEGVYFKENAQEGLDNREKWIVPGYED